MRVILAGVVAVLAVALLTPSPAEAGLVSGKVYENTGKKFVALANKRVEVFERRRVGSRWVDTVLHATRTKSDGSYEINVRRTGRFGIRVHHRPHRLSNGGLSYPTTAVESSRSHVRLTLEVYRVGTRWYLRGRR